MQDFKLSEDEQIAVDIFYTSLEMQATFSGANYQINAFIIKELCESEKLDYMFTLKICKRLLLIENKKLDRKRK
jgi:hypothetical protein